MYSYYQKSKGFTLVEVLVVMTIIGVLSVAGMTTLRSAREKAKIAQAGSIARILTLATEFYHDDMGFYPPDVTRGWDPGFMQPLPYNPDTGQTTIPSCGHCPPNWVTIVQEKWDGPYLNIWPQFTPWNGKYDYNYWDNWINRYGCLVPPGVYAGVQGDYENNNTIPPKAEQMMIDQGYDFDLCINGECQMILSPL